MTFPIFLKIAISMMTFFVKNFKNHILGDFVKIWEFILVITFVIFLKGVPVDFRPNFDCPFFEDR